MIEVQKRNVRNVPFSSASRRKAPSKWDLRDSLDELRELVSSAGAEVVETVTQRLDKPTAPYYIGKGKAQVHQRFVPDAAGHLGHFR